MDPALEQAMIEIRDCTVDPAVVEAAAARVWANLAAHCQTETHAPLHTCADFQALIPEFKAGHLPQARALLVKDHLHECVACRRVYDGRVVELRERSEFSNTSTASDLTIRLGRGSIIVQAAKRSAGHLYVATAD